MWGSCVLVEAAAELAAKAPPPQPGGRGGGGGGGGGNRPAAIVRLQDTNGDDVMDTLETRGHGGQHRGARAARDSPASRRRHRPDDGQQRADRGQGARARRRRCSRTRTSQFLPHFPNWVNSARDGAHSAIYEWNPETKKFCAFSGGNRNSYDYAYNLTGEAFLFDSDMEWDIGMPWYREVRTVHQILNGNYGYRNALGQVSAVLHRLAAAGA